LWTASYAAAFYLLPARVWQLALGAVGALWVADFSKRKWNPSFLVRALALAGLISVFAYGDEVLVAIYPLLDLVFRMLTSGCALILCLPPAPAARVPAVVEAWLVEPLRQSFLFLGDKSYSIYLVHWPLISLGYWAYPELISNAAFILSSTLLLSWLSWFFFEQGRASYKKLVMPVSLALIAIFSTTVTFSDQFPHLKPIAHRLSPATDTEWTDTQADVDSALGMTDCKDPILQQSGALCSNNLDSGWNSTKPTLYLLGDSHAEHLLWGAGKYARQFGYNVVYLYSRFPFANINLHVDRRAVLRNLASQIKHRVFSRQTIAAASDEVEQRPGRLTKIASLIKPNDVLVFSDYSSRVLQMAKESIVFPVDAESDRILTFEQVREKSLKEFAEFLKIIPQTARVLVLIDNPVLKAYPGTCLSDVNRCRVARTDFEGQRNKTIGLYRELTRGFANVQLGDPTPYVCGRDSCGLVNTEGKYLYRDDNHLSPVGGLLLYDLLSQNAIN
jgi:hypothetical protein